MIFLAGSSTHPRSRSIYDDLVLGCIPVLFTRVLGRGFASRDGARMNASVTTQDSTPGPIITRPSHKKRLLPGHT